MKKIKKVFCNLKSDYRHWICIVILLGCLSLIPFHFKYAHLRIWESIQDLGNSCVFYVSELFDLGLTGNIGVLDLTKQPFKLPFFLPATWEGFKETISSFGSTFFSKENLGNYFIVVGKVVFYIAKVLTIILPFFLVFLIITKSFKKSSNNNFNQDTKALKIWKKIEVKVYLPIKRWILGFIAFVKENSYYFTMFVLIWVYSFNLIAIAIEFIAFYLYLICSFKTSSIYIQVLKLMMDLSVMFNFLPKLIKIIIILIVFHIVRKKIGYNRLEHMEYKDRGFINERPIVLMVCGTMGKKKTTMITDMALSQEVMFRNKAFEKILECDLMFPFFPWINLENSIKKVIEKHIVFNLATCRKYIDSLQVCFQVSIKYPGYAKSIKRHLKKLYDLKYDNLIFDYDFKRYGLEYNNNLNILYLWDVIKNYVQLYFVYVVQSSLLIANYSIRTDNQLNDIGNFPMWDMDFFKRDSRLLSVYSRHAHILDFDALRLGKNLIEDNVKANSFEFGVINITEIGKERGNSLENQTIKKNDENCNQKNDLFNSWLKMVRHSATIDNFPFVKVIVDEQRPESWGADARDLCEIIHIDECSDIRLSMPFFFFEDTVISYLISKFQSKYYQYRYDRGDNTLPMYLYHGFISKLNKIHKGIYNTFGYFKLNLNVEKGVQDGTFKESNYYLMSKKIYSKRFSTDCFSDFFNEKSLKSKIGINDIDEFKTEKASFEEMAKENSYFFNDLCRMKKK